MSRASDAGCCHRVGAARSCWPRAATTARRRRPGVDGAARCTCAAGQRARRARAPGSGMGMQMCNALGRQLRRVHGLSGAGRGRAARRAAECARRRRRRNGAAGSGAGAAGGRRGCGGQGGAGAGGAGAGGRARSGGGAGADEPSLTAGAEPGHLVRRRPAGAVRARDREVLRAQPRDRHLHRGRRDVQLRRLEGCTVMEARCDGPEDCPSGQVCCGTLAGNSAAYRTFTCAAQCQSTGQPARRLPRGRAASARAACICANSQLLTNVQVCIDPATIEQ